MCEHHYVEERVELVNGECLYSVINRCKFRFINENGNEVNIPECKYFKDCTKCIYINQ